MFELEKLVVGRLQNILFGLIEWFDTLIMLLKSQMTDVELVPPPLSTCGAKAMSMVDGVAMSIASSKFKEYLLRYS